METLYFSRLWVWLQDGKKNIIAELVEKFVCNSDPDL